MTWMPHRVLNGLLAAVALMACGAETGPPTIALDRSACARCGMLISEAGFAAAYRAGEKAAVFDDIGCLLGALEDSGLVTASEGGAQSAGPKAEVWFLDRNEQWRPSTEVTFVRATDLATPMGGGIQAVDSRAEAEELAASTGGSIFETLDELRAARRAGWPAGSDS